MYCSTLEMNAVGGIYLMCFYFVVMNLAKMAVSVLVVTVLLLSVSEVISEFPSSGKTLDVYNNNCIGFYRYLPDA